MQTKTDLSEVIAENFGANATYVEGLLSRFRSNPDLVDESWRSYFAELLGDGHQAAPAQSQENGQGAASAAVAVEAAPPAAASASKAAPAKVVEPKPTPATATDEGVEAQPIRGGALKIVENMEASISVPTATSQRRIPVKLLDENRRLINKYLESNRRGKTSYTHLIAWAMLRALADYPRMNDGYAEVDGTSTRLVRQNVNLGIAIDLAKKDGSRTLLVPNIKGANKLGFAEFLAAYDDVVKRAREGKLQIADFQGTTISLTNPGTIGTVASTPRLMAGQAAIIATGAIEYPAEYQAMTSEALSQLGISKAITISSTYDHRIIQGAESGSFLARVHELLLGEHRFYDDIFMNLGVPYAPFRWSLDRNPFFLSGDQKLEQTIKEAHVMELINAYRVRGHLIADIDPLHAMPLLYHPELDMETYSLTIWDLDREFITGGLAGTETAPLRDILAILQRAYCGKVGIEYRHIQSKEQKVWIREQIRRQFVEPQPIAPEIKKQLLWKLISAEQFERFLHTKYLGQKRFSLEGSETIIPLLDRLIENAGDRGVEDITMGMAHRGRLNVLANVIGHFCERIFASFEGSAHPSFPADEGDVKYHQGAVGERETLSGRKVKLTLSPNPSHLEAVHAALANAGESVSLYHGKLGSAERRQAQDAFMAGEARVMVTTNAFGMGIDKPDIRFVLHYQMPSGLDSYYQESGRAGRDGEPADCVLLFHQRDRAVQQFFLAGRYPEAKELDAVYAALRSEPPDADGWTLQTLQRKLQASRTKVHVALALLRQRRIVRQHADRTSLDPAPWCHGRRAGVHA